MTRKQALCAAIQVLSDKGDSFEAVRVLQELSAALPLVKWTPESIRDSVEQFILDNGRVPTATDFRRKGLPPHTEFPRCFGMTLGEWLEENYPSERANRKQAASADDISLFIAEYRRLMPSSAVDYNSRRCPSAKSWSTIAHSMQLKRWRELLAALELPAYSRSDKQPSPIRIHIIAEM